MMRKARIIVVVGLVAALIFAGCVGRTEFPTDLPPPDEAGRPADTTYVVVNPIWTEAGGQKFNRPHGVTFGYDRSIYICDTDNDRIVRMSVTGEYIEEYAVQHPVQVTQDRQLNLICVDGGGVVSRRSHFGAGEFDTVLYRDSVTRVIEIQRPGIDSVFYDSLLIDSVWVDSVWIEVQVMVLDTILINVPSGLLGVAASPLPDRYYYLPDSTRSVITVLDVDDHGLAADILRAFARPPAVDPVGIMTYPTGESSYNIVFTQRGTREGLRIIRSGTFQDVRLDTTDIYEMLPSGPKQVARDEEGNFFVVSALADEVYRFTRHGAFSLRFGGSGVEPGQLSRPHGIAYGEKTLYIADTGNDRVVRYRLSTDLQF